MKISIITPSYNSGKYIERAALSVINQDYHDWEHIVVDGGSNDGTLEILEKYDHLKWVSEPDNGQSEAMNKGFALSSGDIIGYLNADDYYNANVFKEVVPLFKKEDIDLVVGDQMIEIYERKVKRIPGTNYSEILKFWNDKFPANPSSYFYRRDVQIKYGLFPENNHWTMDIDFLFFVYRFFKVGYLPKAIGVFCINGENKTAKMNIYEEQKKVLFFHLKKYDKLRYIFFKLLIWYKEESLRLKKKVKNWITIN